ncbi:hypothetical protein [Gimesia aquarii]|uniref:Uncharacterized protein n=1 Tax=Gimesia aquarii TaxID=2527964 RepID=A0A517VP64_9PLAN|nr:hypothetical protein [Gimesia aquarii]QDT94700.1 hypothetical protein V144x_01310 [Gimesia aquarii]
MNLNKTEMSGKELSQNLQTVFSQSATISMSNQTNSATQDVMNLSQSSQMKRQSFSAQPQSLAKEDDEPVLSFKEKAVIWIASFTATGYLISFLFHSTALTIMAIVIVGGIQGNDDFSTLASLDDKDNFGLNDPLDTRIDEEAGGKTTEFNVMQPVKTLTGENDSTLKEIEEDFSMHLGKGEGEEDGDGKGNGGGDFKFKPMGNAVTVGSFTAWTVPKDPDLNEDYLIIIQVKLPYSYKSTRYRASDLSGIVLGTDKHRQSIPWDVRWPNSTFTPQLKGQVRPVKKGGYLPVKKRVSQLIVKVPGSKIPATRDTIKIESKILKEKHTLEIVF